MPGRGRPPKPPEVRINTIAPSRGEWQSSDGIGWQHGAHPTPAAGLLKASKDAWDVWMRSWFAAHWTPDDLPALRQIIRLYDQVERENWRAMTELRQMMDRYGITPNGQQDRRWARPKEQQDTPAAATPTSGHYDHLRLVRDAAS